ncbi:MAG: hypothetical protein CVV51_03050 [Spirochaetae bacterium HGW-Spirochaetae-7]|jgi:hypothetical protein|nr:MAG: hypothetical protein CVV51_03050 [Spirochaetae bacterium HGW-Spirochaetae-7]
METRDKDQVVNYYNRERRLERASADARFMADHYGAKRPGIIRSLTATRSLRYLFFTVGFIIIALSVVSYAMGSRDRGTVAGISLSAKAMWFDGYVYITVKRAAPRFGARKSSGEPGLPVDIRAGDGLTYATVVLLPGEDETRMRFTAEVKPARVAIVAGVTKDGTEATVDLVARVE